MSFWQRLAKFAQSLDASGVPPAAAPAAHNHSGADITSGTVADARIAATIARDSELPDLAGHLADTTDAHAASAITNTPAGAIAATTVQAAINELDSEKSSTGHDHSGTYDPAGTAATAVSTHQADTTSVHGVADTSALYRAGGTDVAIADGGTGASTAAGARANLDLEAGTDFPSQATFDDHSARHDAGGADAMAIDAAQATGSLRTITTSAAQAIGTAAAGAGTAAASSNHVHPASGDTPSTQAFGDSAAAGSSAKAAQSDHKHAMPSLGSTPSTQAFGDSAAGGSATTASKNDHKHAMPTLGYGLSGNSAPAVGLSTASGLATAETTISAATYADIAGASVSLAAGTWLLIGDVVGRSVNARAQGHVAITDGSNTVVREKSFSIPASGTASVNDVGEASVHAIVSPGSTTTYKLRGARGNTTLTNSWTAMDGAGVGVTNNASDNSDKGTGLIAIRIA